MDATVNCNRDATVRFAMKATPSPHLCRLSLGAIEHVRNLVPIPDMASAWPESITAIPMLVTHKPADDKSTTDRNEASILLAMREAGFDTFWISHQLPIGRYDSPVSAYAYEAEYVEFLNHASWSASGSLDEVLLKPLRAARGESKRDLFIVPHMMGSHRGYDFRYPDGYRRIRPTLSDPGDGISQRENARNSYDNTILCTDYVLASISASCMSMAQ